MMGISRRRFLQGAAAGALAAPAVFAHPFVRKSLADTIGNRYLIVLFLDGGNDGLNTVTPIDDGGATLRQAYNANRQTGSGGINLPPESLLSVGTDPGSGAEIGLHPGLAGLHELFTEGNAAVIQGCGYPEYNLSHDIAKTIWQSANPLGVGSLAGTGWVGRHLAQNYGGSAVPGVVIDDSVAGDLRQGTTSVLAIRRLQDFGFPYDEFDEDDIEAKREAFADLYAAATANPQETFGFVGNSGAATLLSSEAYPQLHGLYLADRLAFSQAYSAINRNLARDLREVAKIIYGIEEGVPNVAARFFHVANGGYDTHSDQGGAETDGQHYDLHREVGDSLKVFFDDLTDMGAADKVCVICYSEFSRRIPQNSNGTDHGSQGPMFLIGGKVKAGLYGNHPNINPSALDDQENTPYSQAAGDSFRSTDMRDVYGTVLKHWVNMDHGDVQALLPLDNDTPASEYWTEENFDLDLFDP